ncbi:MAG: hypothetical protein HFJ10_02890 [Lachnospiraceae bacterium]|jgi:hypothetical protein|nr:hypothetical protein [Lachnospiraceae bacterium]
MISLQIQDIKDFMNKLLLQHIFDPFLLIECTITTYNTFHIDGRLHPDFYTKEEQENLGIDSRSFSRWQELRPFCLELIKGTHTPLGFHFVFQLSEENTAKLLEQTSSLFSLSDVNGLVLNLRYDSTSLYCTTGTSLSLFTLDKSLEQSWDQMVQKFLLRQDIAFTPL